MASSIADTLRLKIEHDILMFKLKPGERLDELRLAERFGTSRTPVREALRQLAAEGLVRIRTHRGAVVSGLSMAELIDMFEMMAIYEGVCARLAANHATPDEMGQIAEAHEAGRVRCEADDFDGYCVANVRFHDAIYRASHNGYLIKQTISIRNRLGAYRRFQLRRNNRLRDSFREHQVVFDAIKSGNAEAADCAMREHINAHGSLITSLIMRLPPEYISDGQPGTAQHAAPKPSVHSIPAAALAFE
jgi:DNA-binding GntR family transcriptional regulator